MPPLGLLAVGGPLIDAGHQVRLIDAEFGPLSTKEIVSAVTSWEPDAVFIGHSVFIPIDELGQFLLLQNV